MQASAREHTCSSHVSRRQPITVWVLSLVVLFGIVRITRGLLPAEVRKEIESESMPLGTILINRNIYRNVRLLSFWEVNLGEELRGIFELESPGPLFGRTALIYCDGVPVIELLEIVTAD